MEGLPPFTSCSPVDSAQASLHAVQPQLELLTRAMRCAQSSVSRLTRVHLTSCAAGIELRRGLVEQGVHCEGRLQLLDVQGLEAGLKRCTGVAVLGLLALASCLLAACCLAVRLTIFVFLSFLTLRICKCSGLQPCICQSYLCCLLLLSLVFPHTDVRLRPDVCRL